MQGLPESKKTVQGSGKQPSMQTLSAFVDRPKFRLSFVTYAKLNHAFNDKKLARRPFD
jgi:hypothetical protein